MKVASSWIAQAQDENIVIIPCLVTKLVPHAHKIMQSTVEIWCISIETTHATVIKTIATWLL